MDSNPNNSINMMTATITIYDKPDMSVQEAINIFIEFGMGPIQAEQVVTIIHHNGEYTITGIDEPIEIDDIFHFETFFNNYNINTKINYE